MTERQATPLPRQRTSVVPSPDLVSWTVEEFTRVAQDGRLSYLARGLYAAIQGGLPLAPNDEESRDDIVEGLAELSRLGYVKPRRR